MSQKTLSELLDERDKQRENGPWIVACGGKEPIMKVKSFRVQYMYQPSTGRHAYYNFDTDMFLSDHEYEILFCK